ncbi:amidohydrolase family protein [Luteimonas sp. RIT-PG2_3]
MHALQRCWAWALAGTLVLAAPPAMAAGQVLLSGADLYTVEDGIIRGGQILLQDDRIVAIGTHLQAPDGTTRIDLAGKRIYPGLIDANSILGLFEIGAVPASHDFAEIGTLNQTLSADVAINANAEAWNVARANGVLTALIVPQAKGEGLIVGHSSLMKPQGWTGEEMTLVERVALHLRWPASPEPLQLLEQTFADARVYRPSSPGGAGTSDALRLQSLQPMLQRQLPLMIHVDDAADIRQALAFVHRHKLRAVLVGAAEGWRVAPEIAAARVPVIVGSAHGRGVSRRWERYDSVYANAGKLAAAGVIVAIANDGNLGATRTDNLPYQAATYAAYGLGDDAALRALTLAPAQILGIDKRLGSLRPGKAATLFVTDGDTLDIRSLVERAWIDGVEVDLANNHHMRLYQQYLRRAEGLPKD